MKKICLYIIVIIGLVASCSPDKYELGNVDIKSEDLVEGIAFKIEHDASNPNIVYLTSLMDAKYKPLWNHPQGRSQDQTVTLKIPFEGTYSVQFGVETRGGIVYGEAVTFKVDEMYAGFIEDPMWSMIAGGSGQEKTWYLDLDADGVSRYFKGPIYFFSSWYTWNGLHTAGGDNYLDSNAWDWTKAIFPTIKREGDVASGAEVPGNEAWYWLSDWAGNSWICDAADFGTMTFDLKNAANLVVDQEAYGLGLNRGSFLLDVDNHMIKFSDARPLHDVNRDGDNVDWYNVRILYLNENAMQLGVVPYGDASMTVYNYISKDYYDNWVPGEEEEPEPTLPDGWQDDISQTVQTSVKWVLSSETPFNWANLDGSLMNTTWVSPETYDDWTGFDASIPATYSNFSLTMDSEDNSVVYVDKDGNEQSGTYTLDEKGIYTFSDVTPNMNICSWVNLNTSSDNQWRITAIEKNASGKVTGMWVGVRDAEKPEYMVYHLIPQAGSSSGGGDTAKEIAFDNSKIVYGDLEGNGNLRIEIYNEYGNTASNPPVNMADFVFDSLEVTFTLKGITLKDGASGSYDAAISFASADWSASYWGGGSGDTTVTGNGTYTASCTLTSTNGIVVFVVDVKNIVADLVDLDAVTATLDKIVIK